MRHGGRTRRRILEIIATDSGFHPVELRDGPGYEGPCIHCQARLLVEHDGSPVGDVTIEHIVPKSRDGTDALENLALACGRCNHQKGVRHDARVASARALEVEAALLQRRAQRFRAPAAEEEAVALEIDGELDLHAFAPEDLARLLPAYFEECRQRGVFSVRLVHGKGTGALRRSIAAALRKDPGVERFESAGEKEGGWGATWVYLSRDFQPS